jgi:hypothetical protein
MVVMKTGDGRAHGNKASQQDNTDGFKVCIMQGLNIFKIFIL